jgi:hypothetical protein
VQAVACVQVRHGTRNVGGEAHAQRPVERLALLQSGRGERGDAAAAAAPLTSARYERRLPPTNSLMM